MTDPTATPPAPTAPARSTASGGPMPAAEPPQEASTASGWPVPGVEPLRPASTASGGPMPGVEPPQEASTASGGPVPAAEPPQEASTASTASGAEPAAMGRGPEAGSGVGGSEGDPNAWPPDEAFDTVELDDRGWARRDLEAILLVADEPVPAAVLAEIVGSRLSEVEELLVELASEYARDGRGFVLRAIAGGWRLYTHPGARVAVEAFLRAGQQSRLTRAALETLAVIAYRQPVTRFQVAAVRGVNVDGVFRTLHARGLIQEVGSDPGPGQATLYGTTPAFLEQLGLNGLDQLPPIKDYLPEGIDLVELQEQP